MIDKYGDASQLTGELTRGRLITQPFVAQEAKLGAIGIEFATYQRNNSATIAVDVCKDGDVKGSAKVASSKLEDNNVFIFKLEVELDVNERYELRLYSPNGRRGSTVTAKLGTPLHDNQWIKVNGAKQRSELCCVFYYGEVPEVYFNKPAKDGSIPLLKEFKEEKYTPNPQLSIIIPTAKRLDHLKNCLDSLRLHTESYEVIVIANSPEPDFSVRCMRLLSTYPNHVFVRIPRYAGYVLPCNIGAAISKGEYICILNDDTIVKKGWCDSMIATLEKNSTVAQVGPSLEYMDGTFGQSPVPTSRPYLEGWCFIIPRWVYEKLGLFDTDIDFAYCEDSDFSTNLIHHGYKVMKVESNIMHVGHQTSKGTDAEMSLFTAECEKRNKRFLQKKWLSIWGQQ